jgi:CubicO group peptidase (beta-lactamase class C family)
MREGGEFEWDRPITRDSLIANAGETPYFPPGEAWVYSNTGYAVLGWLLEDVSGQSYADHIQTQIFAPLGMQDSRADDGEAAIVNRAEPYVMADGAIRHATRMTSSVSALGDGGLLVSARDYARWFQELRAPTLISAASERMMRAPAILNSGLRAPYGMGWVLDRVRGRELVAHSGGVPGFISYAIWSPQDDTASFVSSNLASSSAFAAARTLAMELATVHAPDISVRTLEPIRDRNLDRTAVARALLTRADALPDTSLFTPNMRRAFSEQTANDLAPRMPDLTDLTLVEELFFLGLRVHRYRMQRGSRPGPDHLLFAYDRAGRIAWIF